MKNNTHQLSFPNQATPTFKENLEVKVAPINSYTTFNPEAEEQRESSENSSNSNKGLIPMNLKNSVIGNYIQTFDRRNLSIVMPPNIYSSLKRNEKEQAYAYNTIINNYEKRNGEKKEENNINFKNKNKVHRDTHLKKKRERPCCKNTISMEFKLDEVIVNGKKVNFLLDENVFKQETENSEDEEEDEGEEEEDQIKNSNDINFSYNIEIIKSLYENNFSRLNVTNWSQTPNNNGKKQENINTHQIPYIKQISNFINNKKFKKIFVKEIKNSPCLKNKEILNPATRYKISIRDLKSSMMDLQNDYLSRPRKIVSKDLRKIVEEKIIDVNNLNEILVRCLQIIKATRMKGNKNKITYYYESYDCKLCGRPFTTGQGLGGHMSRMHPNTSEQYKIKMNTRKVRSKQRELLVIAKRELLSQHGYDYDDLKKFSQKKLIKKIIRENKSEYRGILSKLKLKKTEKTDKLI